MEHRLVKRGRKNKVEHLIKFVGYGPEHNLWQDDMSNCEDSVEDYWASKPESERCHVVVSYKIAGFATCAAPIRAVCCLDSIVCWHDLAYLPRNSCRPCSCYEYICAVRNAILQCCITLLV